METSEEAIDLKTGEEFHLCISGKAKDLSIFLSSSLFVQRSRREPWTSILKCLFVCHQFLGLWLVELMASDSGSGIPLIQLGVLSLAELWHTQIS